MTMDFDPILMIMQPRRIDEAINSLKENIDIPKVWFQAYTEPQVMAEMNKFVRESNFSHYIVMSDDGIVSKKAADTILKYGEKISYKEVFTGWMNMHIEEDGSFSKISTVCPGTFPPKIFSTRNGPGREGYPPWKSMEWVKKQEGFIPTAMANFAMSIARREMFLRFPLGVHPNGCASDHHWSYRLQNAGIKVWTHPEAFIKHLRRGWHPWRMNWLVGNVKPQIIHEGKWRSREHYV